MKTNIKLTQVNKINIFKGIKFKYRNYHDTL